MKNKKLFNLSAIILGLITLFSCCKVQATERVFNNTKLTRNRAQAYTTTTFSNTITLGISKDRESKNNYTWNSNTVGEAKTVWKIAEIDASNSRNYSDLYYCLNATRGFGITNGEMAEGAIDDYTNSFDMIESGDKSYIINYAGGNLANNYNKVLWILENSYIPIGETNYQKTIAYTNLMEKANIEIDQDERLNLTEDEIEVVQQMAIWYFTNSDNSNYNKKNLPSLYLNNKQLSSIYFYTTQYGQQITGEIRQDKAGKLYKYFIENALLTYTTTQPSLSIQGETYITELENDYIVGPYTLNGENIDRVKSISATSQYNYTLLDESKNTVINNDFKEVLGENFYLKIPKSEINQTTQVKLNFKYTYDFRNLTFMTNPADSTNTQPVVLVEDAELDKDFELVVPISLISVSVEKIWDDNNNQDGIRPNNIEVQLYKGNQACGESITLNQSNNWTYTWTKLLAGFEYTVKELDANGKKVENNGKYNNDYVATYNIETNKTIITNTNNPETTNVSGIKIWDDADNQDGKRPENITVNLLADGEIIESKIVTADKNGEWTYEFINLPKYKNGGIEIGYAVTENSIEHYTTQIEGYEITNSYIPEKTSVSGTKTWEDNNDQDGKRPESIVVNLLADGEKIDKKTVSADKNGNWTYEFTNLPKYKNGKEIKYTITEDKVIEYATSINGYNITNTYTSGKTNNTVKKVWDDSENQDGIRTNSVEVQLYKTVDGTKTSMGENYTVTLNEENNWEYTWENLALKENGKDIVYSVEELEVPAGYEVSYSNKDYSEVNVITITNTHESSKSSKTVKKVWNDNENQDGIRTESVEVQLYKTVDGIKTSMGENYTVTLNEENNWEYTWENLALKENGKDIVYSVVEVEVPAGYEVSYSNDDYSDTNVITIKNTHIPNKFDLSLRKFITQINNQTYLRAPVVDTSKLGTVVNGNKVTTATYKHTKQPIVVQKGDVVTYTIRVYNEGEVDGYVEMITDYLPENLLPIIEGVEGINSEKYKDEIEFNSNWLWMHSDEGNIITTTITSKDNSETYAILTGKEEVTDTKLNAYVQGSNKLDYIDVQIKCLVTDSAVDGEYLTNIAEISKMCDVNGVEVETDIDSTKANVDYSNLGNYKNEEAISSETNSYIEGQEDDDDFEKIWVKEFDLSLRKFITKINETSYSRAPVVDTSKLGTVVDGKTITTATYNHSKEPVIVETGDLVTYKIRIYNEGSLAGFANEITDDIPDGLEFLPDSSVNVSYRWEMLDSEGNKTEDASKAVMIVTDYLSDIDKNNIINAVTEKDGVKTLSYKDVEVQFKVIAKAEKLKDNLIINEAQISDDSDIDIDSIPNRDEKYDYITGKNEDDIDYEPIKLQYFDLALRKFITKVNTTDYNNRYPEVIYNDDGSIKYNHTKDPVLVTTGDTIVYTIRVYNEGEKIGTATEITDNLPEGLEFLLDNETNKTYGWKLLDEAGNETQDLSKAVKVTTNTLANETIEGIIIKEGHKVLSYKDVQIVFKVVEENTSNKILVNTAEISKDSDDDVDSTPDNKVEIEDDLDKEYVKVKYFDLALKKWVTSTQVTYNGKTTTTKTGFTEDSEGIAKVDLVAKQMKKTTVKFTYNIKVINEGEIPGYAYEVKDYIPDGLKFVQEDNKDWKEVKDGVVVTDKLKDTLLNPGESAIVEITLTWENSTTNLALKTNYAEITQDSGDDIDSTPDNFNKKEDDIDDAQVILSIKTAGATTYVGLILTSVSILAVGIFLIKKYVIR